MAVKRRIWREDYCRMERSELATGGRDGQMGRSCPLFLPFSSGLSTYLDLKNPTPKSPPCSPILENPLIRGGGFRAVVHDRA